MKRAFRIIGIVFLMVVVPGGLVALYELHRAEREERIREELRETQETQQALLEENKNLNLRLRELTKQLSDRDKKAQEIDRARRQPARVDDTNEEALQELFRRRRQLLEEQRKLLDEWRRDPRLPREIEPRRWNPMDDRYQDVPHPDATKRKRRTFS